MVRKDVKQIFEMMYISYDLSIINIHFQKLGRINLEVGRDTNLK